MKKDFLDLTNPQKSIWNMEQFYKGTNINNISGTVVIKQKVNFDRLNEAINFCLKNNKSFSLKFKLKDGDLVQSFSTYHNQNFEFLRFKDEKELRTACIKFSESVFDIFNDNLFNFKLFELDNGFGGFFIMTHHIISDAATFSVIVPEIIKTYIDLENGNDLSSKDFSYEDYINAEFDYIHSDKFLKDKSYWETLFETVPEVATLPGVNSNSSASTGKAERLEFSLNKNVLKSISSFCKENKVSIFNFFMAVYSIYLGRVCHLKDFVIGTPILNRSNFKEKNTTGMFINTAPLRITIKDGVSFVDFCKQIANNSLKMLRHQRYPYQKLLESLRKKDNSIPNLFDLMLSYQITKANDKSLAINYDTEWLPTDTISDGIYVHIHDNDASGALNIAYDYQLERYSKNDINDFHARILNIINQVLKNEDCLEKDIEIVTKEEKNKILNTFNRTSLAYAKDKSVIRLFEEQVSKNANGIAVVYGSESLTYNELNDKATRLANSLISQGVKKGNIVPVLLNRSIELIVSMLAILKCGAIYLPISTEFPKKRIDFILKNSGAKLLICDNNFKNSSINIYSFTLASLDEFSNKPTKVNTNPDDSIYIIYTSGSTGTPKGVKICNRNLNNFVSAFTKYFGGISKKDKCLASTNITFDVSIFEFFVTLLNGAVLHLYEENSISDVFDFCKKLDDCKITLAYLPPNILEDIYAVLSKNKTMSLNKILIGVEPIRSSTMKKFYELNSNLKVVNAYGPTETTICATAVVLDDKVLNSYNIIPIGKPLYNNKIAILDENFKVVPIGSKGEIFVFGDGVGNKYLNNEQKSNESFISLDIFGKPEIAYRTGDLAMWNEDGTISFIGRDDNQVKVSGHRIELGEIESCIYKFPDIEKVVVIIDKFKRINAYFTAKSKIDTDNLKNFILTSLPSYFVPHNFMQVDSFALTQNGKIDKKLLPEIKVVSKHFKEPKNKLERTILGIYKDVLNLDKISTDDDFFELGGDSLSIIKLSTKLNEVLTVQVSIKTLFNNPTISSLAKALKGKTSFDRDVIKKVPKKDFYETSSAQKRLYLSSLKDGKNSVLYNIGGASVLSKTPNMKKLNYAFNELIKNNESLRTYFELVDGEIVQKIKDEINFVVEYERVPHSNIAIATQDFIKPFDLSKAPLFRAKVVKLRNGKTLLLMDIHHIIGDGETMHIITRELSKLYNGENVEKKSLDYKDFAVWENNQNFKESEKFWLDQFSDDIPVLTFPTNFQRPVIQSFEGNSVYKKLNKKVVDDIYKVCKNLNITPYMLLLGVYYVLISEYSASDDIVVGTPVIGRTNPELKNIIGMFVNTLALRNHIVQEEGFDEFIMRIKDNCLKAFEHQDYPLDRLVQKLNIPKDTSRNPLFDVLFSYQNGGFPLVDFKGINSKVFVPKSDIAKFDLSLEAILENDCLNLKFEYCTKLFSYDFIDKMCMHYINILKVVLKDINIKISNIDMISRAEKKQILNELNDTKTYYDRDKTVTQLFEEQIYKTPGKTAVVFENEKLTYRQLNKKANQLANYIKKYFNVKKQDRIAIFMKKSMESIVAILATIKLGAIFVPIDVDYPAERIDYILKNSKAKLVLTLKQNNKLIDTKIQKLNVNLKSNIYNSAHISNLGISLTPEDIIYVMYTSGSTGKPKGVMVKHINVVRLVQNTNYIDFSKCKKILQTGSIVFDACTFEIWGALLNGLALYIISKNDLLNTTTLEKYLLSNNIDTLWLTAPLFNQLCEENPYMFKEVKFLLTGGDVLSPQHINMVKEANPNITLINGYGPTENTTFSCCFTIDKKYTNSIPIGKPIANSTAYVVSKSGKIQPIGVPGELWVGGDGVSKGYLNRKDLTKEKFIKNPFGKGKVYKTGDLVKVLPNGNIDFIGRFDNQVKIRGFRVELSEIDNVIKGYHDILELTTIVKNINRSKVLITYFTSDVKLNVQDIVLYLKERLPSYMVPQYLIQLDSFPLTINGKINKNELPMPVLKSENKFVPPENEIQEKLCEIWCKLFNMKKVSILDNFFELGGDSLLAIRFQTEALKYDLNISYSDIFEYQTIQSLSEKKYKKNYFKIHKKHNYSKLNDLLACNSISNLETSYDEIPLGPLVLFGATGYLGAHILDAFLNETDSKVFCVVRRKNNEDSELRLKKILNFYFDNKYNNEFGKRIFVVYGDITKENFGLSQKDYTALGKEASFVVNSAALVKHYGDFDIFNNINVTGTKNIVEFCKKFHNKLYHISTMSVAGMNELDEDIRSDEERILFDESKLYVGQNLNNVYVYTKFQAERVILEELNNGLDSCILRAGNIFNRASDGRFQINVSENAYINRIKALLKLGVVQNRFVKHALEFTPVDSAAKAVIEIAKHDHKFNVLHLFNTNLIDFPDIIAILNDLGYKMDMVSDEVFANTVKKFLKDEKLKSQISGLIPDLNKNKTLSVVAKTLPNAYFTSQFLKTIGFEWPEINKDYVEQFLNYFNKLGYLN